VTARFELTVPAERDLEEIFFEVKERHGRLVAERVYGNLLRTFDLLANMPEMGRHRPELRPPPYRFWPTGPAYIAYRGDVRPIRIVRIARASRDWSRFAPSG
jgi:plasmid stabilization system protein ParE